MDAGKRDRLVTFKAPTTTTDDYGQEIEGDPATIEQAWARVKFGTAAEKREAAQERFAQSAIFEVDPSAALIALGATAFITFDGNDWDIQGPGEHLDRNTLRFTAVRSV